MVQPHQNRNRANALDRALEFNFRMREYTY